MDSTRRILIVDDAAMFRELGSLFLARTGAVRTANNGFEGLLAVRGETPDVVVADLDMPCMDGAELCRRMKADPDLRRVPVILVTPGDRAEDRARAVRAGADDVIAKPISRITLIQAVNRFLRAQVRGLARVGIETRVHVIRGPHEIWGHARNLSRGGIFVEADELLPPASEVALEFRLDESETLLAPTAQVIWRRPETGGARAGMGLQFLALDRDSAHCIDNYVYEHPELSPDGTAPLHAAAR